MRMGLLGQVRRVWAPRAVKVIQKVEFERKWLYLNLAVNGRSGTLRWTWSENMKSETIADVLEGWGKEEVKVVVWDRAPRHHEKAYEGVHLQQIEQTSYSPELKPAERVFEYLRAQIEGKTYGSLEAKKAAVEAELKKLAADPEKVKRLAGWEWILGAWCPGHNTRLKHGRCVNDWYDRQRYGVSALYLDGLPESVFVVLASSSMPAAADPRLRLFRRQRGVRNRLRGLFFNSSNKSAACALASLSCKWLKSYFGRRYRYPLRFNKARKRLPLRRIAVFFFRWARKRSMVQIAKSYPNSYGSFSSTPSSASMYPSSAFGGRPL